MSEAFENGIGIMSGTSLDGLDIAYCKFQITGEPGSNYQLLAADTIQFPDELTTRLQNCIYLEQDQIQKLDMDFGEWIGDQCRSFIQKNKINPDFIASHGHTVFHKPDENYTLQIGDGSKIHERTKLPVVCNFRQEDVRIGGQGAPLVPIGDELLFGDFDYCLNLGGFANISLKHNGVRVAYDICPVNIVLNELARGFGKSFDENGDIASSGQLIPDLLERLTSLAYYDQEPPKSLGKEWVDANISPLLNSPGSVNLEDIVHTFSIHAIQIIVNEISKDLYRSEGRILVTGGGTYNSFIIENLKNSLPMGFEVVIPRNEIVDFKEAIVFALMGHLRLNGRINILSSVTGASKDLSAGNIIGL